MATICLSGALVLKAGKNAVSLTQAQYDTLIDEAEAYINAVTKYDFTSNWATISGMAAGKMVREAVSSWAAMNLVSYDMSGYSSRLEAQTILDVLWSKCVECINALRDDNVKTFVNTGVLN